MEGYLWLLYDLLVLLILFFTIRVCAKKGFVRTVVWFVGLLLSLTIASAASEWTADIVYTNYVRENVVTQVEETVKSIGEENEITVSLDSALEKLPDFVKNALESGFGVEKGFDLTQSISGTARNIGVFVADQVVRPLFIAALKALLFVIYFILLMFVVKLLSRMLKSVNAIPLVGTANMLLGGIIGAVEAVLILFVLAWTVNLVAVVTNDGIPFMTRGIINQTYLFQFFVKFNFLI